MIDEPFLSTLYSLQQFDEQMEETRAGSRSKKQIAPKITSTKITISKSTPFLISKHHLDDTQMRSVLNYDDRTVKNNHKRTYSYKAQVVSCANSKVKQRFETFQNNSNHISRPEEKEKREQYYPQTQNKLVQVQSRVFKSRVKSNCSPQSKNNANKNTDVRIQKQSAFDHTNDYGMQEKQLNQARSKLQQQAQKLRKIYKKNVQKDLKVTQIKKINQLQEQINHLKIKNLELQKQRLLNECLKTKQTINGQTQRVEKFSNKKTIKQRYFSILQKPRFRIKHEQNDDTDSSFSSFQLQ